MTDQASEKLVNEHPDLDFGELRVFGIIRGNPNSNHGWGESYEFEKKAKEIKVKSSALWRGHIKTFQLTKEGRLKLIKYGYPHNNHVDAEEFEEEIEGDFWIVMKERFRGPRTYVRFNNGLIDSNRSNWVEEKPTEPGASHNAGKPAS